MAKKFSYAMHQEILTLHFRPGAQVEYPNVPGERQYRGKIECEKTAGQPGWYYVRNDETQMLDLVLWCYLRLARREEVAS